MSILKRHCSIQCESLFPFQKSGITKTPAEGLLWNPIALLWKHVGVTMKPCRGYYAHGKGYLRIRLLTGYAFERSRLAPNAKLGETCAARPLETPSGLTSFGLPSASLRRIPTRRYGIVVFRSPLRRNCVSPSSQPCNTPIVIYRRFQDAS